MTLPSGYSGLWYSESAGRWVRGERTMKSAKLAAGAKQC